MITERDRRLAELRADATAGDLPDILWLLDEIERLDRALETLKPAAMALLQKLDAVHADSRYLAVWQSAQCHIGKYEGPTYTNELMQLEKALILDAVFTPLT